jgi:hypothetical protein
LLVTEFRCQNNNAHIGRDDSDAPPNGNIAQPTSKR